MRERIKNIKRGLLTLLLLAIIFSCSSISAFAAIDIDLDLHYVADIDNVKYPSTSQFTAYDGLQGIASFVITKPTIIKAYFNWEITTTKKVDGRAWISRDSAGLDIVDSVKNLSKMGDSILIFLDPGTYYINHLFSVKNDYGATYLKMGVALLAEDVKSDEDIYASSYFNSNDLTIGKATRGFLSITSPIDYYKFIIKDKSEVTINYNFEQTDDVRVSSGVCKLFDSENQKITSKNFSTSGSAQNIFSAMLETGTYYISLSDTTSATNLEANVVSYSVTTETSTKNWTNKDVTIGVSTDFEPTQMVFTNKLVTDVNINDNLIWSTRSDNCFVIESNKFIVKKNGYYTVRLRDDENYLILKRIKIVNIDKTSPTISGVANKKTYKKGTVIKFYDNASSVKVATLNGSKVKSGTKISKIGKYTLRVYDNAGNRRTVVFYIK